MKREVLKSLALKAKNRMIHKNGASGVPYTENEGLNIKVIKSNDDIFYSKVRMLLESNEDILNPIKQLMDENILLKLDAHGKEKYLLETVEKYHKFRKMIQEEKEYQYGC